MPFTLTMPKLSPTMESGTITNWNKKEGDFVEVDDVIFEVATDKATVEYNALDSGWLRKILVPEGKEAAVNQPVAIFTEKKDEKIDDYKPEGIAIEEKKVEAAAAPQQEKPAKTVASEEQKKGGLFQPSFIPEQPLENYTFEHPTQEMEKRILASPVARKVAKEKGLDLSTVKGTGPNQRIMKEDLEKAQPSGVVVFSRREPPKEAPGSYEEELLSPMRKVIGQRLQESKTFIPHFYVRQEVCVDSLVEIREQLRNWNLKLSINDFVVRACALALRKHPGVNSGFNSVNQSIIRFKTVDISVAVSVNAGLITPIVRHADYKNLGEISVEVRSLAERAKAGKLDASEYKGGSFTVSNLGMYGVTDFQAIINPPQGAILAVSGIHNCPIIKDKQVVPGKIMNITLSVDHRVIDGVAAAEFMKTMQEYLENPAGLVV